MFIDMNHTSFVPFQIPEKFHCRHSLKCFPFSCTVFKVMSGFLIRSKR